MRYVCVGERLKKLITERKGGKDCLKSKQSEFFSCDLMEQITFVVGLEDERECVIAYFEDVLNATSVQRLCLMRSQNYAQQGSITGAVDASLVYLVHRSIQSPPYRKIHISVSGSYWVLDGGL
jgi:hypothetical protein